MNTVQSNSFIASTLVSRVVRGPNHGPRVDIEHLAARARRPSLIARAPGIAGVSATGHAAGNRAEIPGWDQGQAAEDVRQRIDIDYRIRRIPALPGTVSEQGFDQGALTLHDRPCVRANTNLEDQVDPPIPARINGWANTYI